MLDKILNLFKCLSDHDVKYVVIGGVAAMVHGLPRSTFDVDLLIEATEENAQRLLDAFLDAGLRTASLTGAKQLLSKEITSFRDLLLVDVQTRTPGLPFEQAWANRVEIKYKEQPIFVASKADVIASKRAANRRRDQEDVRILLALDEDKKA